MERKDQTKATAEGDLWRVSFKRLVAWTVKRHRVDPADAEEMVQEAIAQFVNTGGVADPSAPESLLQALGSRINGVAVDKRRKKSLHAVSLTADGAPAELDDPPDAEAQLVSADFARRGVSALLERVSSDDLVFGIVMQFSDGVESAAEQAKALQQTVGDIYKARRRLSTHVEAIKKLMEGW